jgi:hypothetical protein
MTDQEIKNWVRYQRWAFIAGRLSPEKFRLLKNNGFDFERQLGQNLLKDHPLFKEVHPIRNKGIDFSKVSTGSGKKLWWLGKCGHEWEARIDSRTAGSGCSFCSGRYLSKENCLQKKHPHIAKMWNYEKNGKVTPENIVAKSDKKYHFITPKGKERYSTTGNMVQTYGK